MMMSKPIAYVASLDCGNCTLSGHGATKRSAMAALDAAIFEHGEARGYLDNWYVPLAGSVTLQPIILGSAWCDRKQLEGISEKDEIRARDPD
ncbi:MAG: hypothetical protein QOH47_2444 [Sphingomonadales bacterium]|jgi:hypothetical protein|nr:hypothetical protein [Sphingomonadales bacterium]